MGSDFYLLHHYSTLCYSLGFCSSEVLQEIIILRYKCLLFSYWIVTFSRWRASVWSLGIHVHYLLVSSGHIKNTRFIYFYLLPLFCWDRVLACIAGWTQTYMILLSQLSGYRYCRRAPPCPSGILDLCVKPLLNSLSPSWKLIECLSTELSAQWMPFLPSLPPYPSLFLNIYFFNSWVGVYVLVETRRGHQIPWSWSYKRLWAAWAGCWELDLGPLEEQPVTAEPPLQLQGVAVCVLYSGKVSCITPLVIFSIPVVSTIGIPGPDFSFPLWHFLLFCFLFCSFLFFKTGLFFVVLAVLELAL